MKKVIFALVLVAVAFNAALVAQTETDFTVTLTGDSAGVLITKYTGKSATVRIPAKIQGMPVREIGKDAFSENSIITNVIIPEGVTTIEEGENWSRGAFLRCVKLTSVTLPSTLTTIGNTAFAGCTALRSITIPEGVTRIGDRAFANCSSLASVNLPSTLTEIGEWAFSESWDIICNSGAPIFTSIVLPKNLKTIGEGAFSDCKITSLVIPEGITTISRRAFGNCTALISVTLPSTITRIFGDAFVGCTALTAISIPDAVESIEFGGGYMAGDSFRGCAKMTLASQAAIKKRGYTGSF